MKRKRISKIMSFSLVFLLLFATLTPHINSRAELGEDIEAESVQELRQEFTEEEIQYIRSHRTLKVAYVDDSIPVSYTDPETGELGGISREIFDRISEESGFDFEYVALPAGPISLDYLCENDFDLVTGIEQNDVNLNVKAMLMSEPYLTSKRVMVCKNDLTFDNTAEYRMAVPTGSAIFKKVVEEAYPNFEIVTYDTQDEAFKALIDDKQDMVMVNQYVASYSMTKPRYRDFTIIPVEGMDDNLCFSALVDVWGMGGLSPEEAKLIIGIINKSINNISANEIDNIVIKAAMETTYQYTFSDFIYLYRFAIIGIAVMLLIIFMIYIWMLRVRNKRDIQLKEEQKKIILQQKRYKMIFDNSDELLYEISLSDEPCIASEKIREKFGWDIPVKVDTLSIKTLSEILHVHPDDEDQFFSSTEGLIANKEAKDLQVRLGRDDGSYIWCKVVYLPILDDDNNMVSIVGKIVDVDDSVREKKNLEMKTRMDSLSGLLNKNTFEEEVRQYIDENTAVSSAFVFVDMDYFKNVNDLLGHAMGDQVIKDTAVKLQVIFANCDLVSRFGGDEFCIFVKDIPSETLADKLNFAVDKLSDVYTNNGVRVSLTASIGAAYCSSPSIEYDKLLDCADRAVYQAKENGRNQYVIGYL